MRTELKPLYKSALYIEEEPLKELIEVIDIFSVSLKGMDPEMYKNKQKENYSQYWTGLS